MADRYWVGGTGTWDATSTTNWSATSGGASGASVPTSADSVFFDQAGSYTVTLSGTIQCLNFSTTAGDVRFVGPGGTFELTVHGNLNTTAGTFRSTSSGFRFAFASTTGATITTNTCQLPAIIFVGLNGTFTLGSSLNLGTGSVFLATGTFNLNGFDVTCGAVPTTTIVPSTGQRTINFGANTISISTGTTGPFFASGGSLGTGFSGAGGFKAIGSGSKTISFQNHRIGLIEQAGAGTLDITGNVSVGTFTNTYKSTGATTVRFGASSSNSFENFLLSGEAGRVCTLTTVTAGQARLAKSTPWNVGANSIDSGNNTSLIFAAGGGIDYLNISNINGVTPGGANFIQFFMP